MSATCLKPAWPHFALRIHHSLRPRARNLPSHSRLSLRTSPFQRCLLSSSSHPPKRRRLLTLAIESSCDDTCVTILEKDAGPGGAAHFRFDEKITFANVLFRGVHPILALELHTRSLATMVHKAMRALPHASEPQTGEAGDGNRDAGASGGGDMVWVDGEPRRKPDFVTVTRGPGMRSNLTIGLNTAKGLAVAWDVPLLGVNHMQAHALTSRLVSALEAGEGGGQQRLAEEKGGEGIPGPTPEFPFLSLLVSGGHSMLALSRSLNDHATLATSRNIAVGDLLDKCGRLLVPPAMIAAAGDTVVYGALLEQFAFPRGAADYEYAPPPTRRDEIKTFDSGFGWKLYPPLSETVDMFYEFAGLRGQVQKILREQGSMNDEEHRLLARHVMRIAFEQLAGRLMLALSQDAEKKGDGDKSLRDIRTLAVAGGVACNRYMMHILRSMLDIRGFSHIGIVSPPSPLCTDNAGMIAWTGMEMYEAGWQSELDIDPIRKWPLDPKENGGILGVRGWRNTRHD
ncbi:glycoprotease family-domain-containing protein [Jackrogersella minutella]|nr:glycoprotease family-domain-containing protein [Jackrogersella minutella]